MRGPPAPETPEIALLERLAQYAAEDTPSDPKAPAAGRGVAIHLKFEAMAATAFGRDHIEVTYYNGSRVGYGTPGGSRADVVIGPLDHPLYVVDLKTSGTVMKRGQLRQYGKNLPPGTLVIVLYENRIEP